MSSSSAEDDFSDDETWTDWSQMIQGKDSQERLSDAEEVIFIFIYSSNEKFH